MIPTHATKNRVRYRYYVSRPHLRGGAKQTAGSITRVPAPEIEVAVSKALAVRIRRPANSAEGQSPIRDLARMHINRIEVRKDHLALQFNEPSPDSMSPGQDGPHWQSGGDENGSLVLIPWFKPPSKRFREVLLPPSASRNQVRPIKAERRVALIKSIARGREWLDEIVTGAAPSVEQIAARQKCSVRHVNMTISMAFIAPALVQAAVEGRLPRGIGVASLRDAPAEWTEQFKRLGLAQAI